jgi:hypothetical protein
MISDIRAFYMILYREYIFTDLVLGIPELLNNKPDLYSTNTESPWVVPGSVLAR